MSILSTFVSLIAPRGTIRAQVKAAARAEGLDAKQARQLGRMAAAQASLAPLAQRQMKALGMETSWAAEDFVEANVYRAGPTKAEYKAAKAQARLEQKLQRIGGRLLVKEAKADVKAEKAAVKADGKASKNAMHRRTA